MFRQMTLSGNTGMKISLIEASRHRALERVLVWSLDNGIYTAQVEVAGEVMTLTDDAGKALTARNITAMRDLLAPLAGNPGVLCQRSAYDEMVGQPGKPGGNQLEVPLFIGGVEGDVLH